MYRAVAAVLETSGRGNFHEVEVTKLPCHATPQLNLWTILNKRLEVTSHPESAGELFTHDALAQVQGSYLAGGHHDLCTGEG